MITESKSDALTDLANPQDIMGRLMGVEPTHTGATILCLNRLTTAAMSWKYLIGASGGTRTPGPRLRRPMLYPAELQTQLYVERVKGIGPSQLAWKARALPLSYTRIYWSGWQDLNPRPSGPKPDALPNCATPRLLTKPIIYQWIF